MTGTKSCGCVVETGLPVGQFLLTVRGGIATICYAGWSVELWAELVAVSIGSEGETDFPAVTASGGDGDTREDHGFEAAAHKFRRVGVALGASSYPSGHPTPARRVETRPSHERRGRSRLMNDFVPPGGQGRPEASGIPARILVAGSDLLAGALASALQTYGFATRIVLPREPEIGYGIDWRPNLVLVDVRSLDVTSGFALVGVLSRSRLPFCVIDSANDGERENLWRVAGASAVIDRSQPFDELFRTITRLLRKGQAAVAEPRSSPPRA